MHPTLHLIAISIVTLIFLFLLFYRSKKSVEEQFVEDADALRDAIKEEPVFDRKAWEKVITDLKQTYKGRIEAGLWQDKLDEVYTAFNNRADTEFFL